MKIRFWSTDCRNLDGGWADGERLRKDGVRSIKLAQLKNSWTWATLPEVYDSSPERNGRIQAFPNCWKTTQVCWYTFFIHSQILLIWVSVLSGSCYFGSSMSPHSLRASSLGRFGNRVRKERRACNYVFRTWIPATIPLWLPIDWAVRFPPISAINLLPFPAPPPERPRELAHRLEPPGAHIQRA